MRSVGLKVLNNKLSEYVRLAAAGETVLVTDRDRVVAEIVPPRAERSPILADALLAGCGAPGLAVTAGSARFGPPSGADTSHDGATAPHGAGRRQERPLIYIDASVALAHLFAEDRRPPAELWNETLVASRLVQYEVWTRVHGRNLAESHGAAASAILGRIALLELTPPVLSRALAPFPLPLRTPRRTACGVDRAPSRAGADHRARDVRPPDDRRRPGDGHPVVRSAGLESRRDMAAAPARA